MSKKALGKGIASLIKVNSASESARSFSESVEKERDISEVAKSIFSVPINKIRENSYQPRKRFNDIELKSLSDSIRENGIIQPLVVSYSEKGSDYELIAGERRLRAAKLADLTHVPVIFKNASQQNKLVMAIVENVQRADLDFVEEAEAYNRLLIEFKLTQQQVAHLVGKERSSVANFLRVLKLPSEVLELAREQKLSFGHAKLLTSLKLRGMILRFAKLCVDDGLSVRELENRINQKNLNDGAPKRKKNHTDHTYILDALEKKTGLKWNLNFKNNGSGQLSIKFSDKNDFNNVYDYLINGEGRSIC